MVKVALLAVLALCLVALAYAGENRLTAEASRTRFPGGKQDSVKISQDAWRSKDGKWSAGGYVQHDRTKFGGHTNKNTHAGVQVQGRWKRDIPGASVL